jgi:hypothetical protein
MSRKPHSDLETAEFNLDHRHEWTGQLGRDCAKAVRNPKDRLFRRGKRDWRVFAGLMSDFMLDVANGAELWRGYEAWNRRHFGVALPVTEGEPGTGVTGPRLAHCVWKMLAVLDDGWTPPPDHPDVLTLTEAVSAFWEKRRSDPPNNLGSAAFVAGPNREGSLVKYKLRILAETSYFFRFYRRKYLAPYAGTESEIDAIDDFLCRACTPWSGMGPVDLLAGVLEAPEARRADIRSWSQKHLAPYRVKTIGEKRLVVINLVTGAPYETEFDNPVSDFYRGMMLFGALVPWDGHWRWSGIQRLLSGSNSDESTLRQVLDTMKRTMSRVLCRYWPEYREKVFAGSAELHEARLADALGRDLLYFKDAKSFIEDYARFSNKRDDELWLAQTAREAGESAAAVKPPPPPLPTLPAPLRDNADGVGEFLDPVEGSELVFGYDFLRSALEKRGAALTRDERSVLREFIQGNAVGPAFVKRVLRDYSPAAIQAEFGLPAAAPDYWLEWLLRCWKGEHYRVRYPELSVV